MRCQAIVISCILISQVLLSCSPNNPQSSSLDIPNYDPGGDDGDTGPSPGNNTNDLKYRWDVPGGGGQIVTGCFSRDCIPSLEDPELISAQNATKLNDDDLILGLTYEDDARAYPLRILDWHEIVNQTFGATVISITYCLLTGSGLGIHVTGTSLEYASTNLLTFGISGLLYNNNLIPYDRGTGSNWSQMLLRCVNGVLRGTPMITVPLIETSWKSWKQMFPNSKVLSDNTGFDRPYDIFPYGVYRTDPFLLFSIQIDDTRLPRKERVHGIITDRFNPKAKIYRFRLFENGARAINDDVNSNPVVIAGMESADFYISYSRLAKDRTILTFDVKTETPAIYPFDLIDNEGTVWNILGKAVSGPRSGEQLTPTVSYNAYWFAWGTFFPDVLIYGE